MAIAAVLKTAVRKDFWVRVPGPPLRSRLPTHPQTMFSTPLARLRTIGFLEGLSFLVLLGIAMPLKYVAGKPEMVSIVGSLHGGLFVLYAAAVAHVMFVRRWPIERAMLAMVAAVVPFGPFFFDRSLKREEAESASVRSAAAA